MTINRAEETYCGNHDDDADHAPGSTVPGTAEPSLPQHEPGSDEASAAQMEAAADAAMFRKIIDRLSRM